MPRILIAGCGDVGTELGLRLVARGHRVGGLRRHPQGLPVALEPIAADLASPSSLEDLPPALDVVVYAAAADRHDETAYRAAYLDGVKNLIAALAAQGQTPRRLLFTSSTGVYGQDDGGWVDETSPTEPRSFSGRILLAAERAVLDGPFAGTVVRLGGIYGPGRTRLLRGVCSGEATYSPERPVYANRIHRDDCAGALAHLIARDLAGEPLADVYLGVDSEPAERGEVLRWLAERLGAPPPRAVPGAASRRGGSKRCCNHRLLATGYQLHYPTFREGYPPLFSEVSPPPSAPSDPPL